MVISAIKNDYQAYLWSKCVQIIARYRGRGQRPRSQESPSFLLHIRYTTQSFMLPTLTCSPLEGHLLLFPYSFFNVREGWLQDDHFTF
jgi:hypothetical protein